MAIYQLTKDCPITGHKADSIKRKGVDGAPDSWIPMNVNNIDYQEYLAWVEEGNTPDPA